MREITIVVLELSAFFFYLVRSTEAVHYTVEAGDQPEDSGEGVW